MTSSPRPTHWVRWTIAALLIIALGSGIWRSLATRKAQQAELGASVSSANSIVLDLTPLDVLSPKSQPLAPTLPIAGTIRALHTAQVKARVPGELRDLVVREGDSVAAGQVLARPRPPTALFTGSKLLTLGALRYLWDQGVRVPDDVALAVFDPLDWLPNTPEMLSVTQPAYEIGQQAARLLLARLEHPDRPPERLVLPSSLARVGRPAEALKRSG